MKRVMLGFGAVLAWAGVVAGTVTPAGAVDLTASPDYLRTKLTELTQLGPRQTKAQRAAARAYLAAEYGRMGYAVSMHEYPAVVSPGGVNFVAQKQGRDPSRYLILSSHYDSEDTQGADDNGSGTISVMAIAEALKDMDLQYSVRVVAFDEEERGLVGSAAYVRELQKNKDLDGLMGVINIEMTGYDSDGDGGFHVIDCDRPDSMDLSRAIMDIVNRDGLALRRVSACTNRSDHASFWNVKKPAVVVSENFFGGDGNPCYHRACDQVGRLNFDYMSKVTTALMRAAAGLVLAQ